MDLSLFSSESPGQLVEIEGNESAFLPNPLPPTNWAIGQSTWPLLADAMHELGRLDGVAMTLPNPGILTRPLESREALRSSSLEGTYATPRELMLFDMPDDGKDSKRKANDRRDNWREVWNYRHALNQAAQSSLLDAPLHMIRQLHSMLLTGVRGHNQTPGTFRTRQVFIGADHRFIPPPPTHVLECLGHLETFIKNPNPGIPPLIRAFLAHYQFETIHPFLDGNGRVGRLLMTLMIRELCKHSSPWLYLSAFFDHHKTEYIDKLFAVSAQGAWKPWVEFCLHATIAQAKDTFDRCTRLMKLRESYRQRVGAKPRLSIIVDLLFDNQYIRAARVQKECDVSYPTAQRDIDALVSAGILTDLDMYPRTFCAMEIYSVTFYEPDRGGAPPADE